MRIKKFKNLWTMGLILSVSILSILYLIKLIFPNFVVGVAELPSIVKIGTYIDSHSWLYYLFTFSISLIASYFYNCACISERKLNYREFGVVSLGVLFLLCMQQVSSLHYQMVNDLVMIITPCILCYMRKKTDIRQFYMTALCLAMHSMGQIFSLGIRDIDTRISYPNSATFTILLIDAYIWTFILYSFSNYKKEKQ